MVPLVKMAIVNYSQVIRLKPEDPDGYYQRACLFELENELVYANEDFKMVRQLDPSNEHAIHNLAVYSFQRQLWDDAIQAFTKLIRLNGMNGQARIAVLYYRLKKYELAVIDYTTDPIQLRAYLCRGDLFQILHSDSFGEMGDTSTTTDKRAKKPKTASSMTFIDKAIRDYSKAIHLCPSDYLLYLYRGKLLLKQGRMKESTYDFHSAFELNASIAQTFVQRALVLSFQRKYTQIIQEFNQRSKIENIDDPALYMLIAKARVKCNDNEGAIRDLTKALEYNKKDPQIYLQKGICYENLKDWTNAAAEFTKCIALNPSYAKVL
ncbi:cytochrome c oxidase subunit 1 [Irineochytrium annulatum]|nr:cytochrome c oxidase subunit 1 [Irineochytrium annulatum]